VRLNFAIEWALTNYNDAARPLAEISFLLWQTDYGGKEFECQFQAVPTID
jgi:hypothetical protein